MKFVIQDRDPTCLGREHRSENSVKYVFLGTLTCNEKGNTGNIKYAEVLRMGFWREIKTDACESKRIILAGNLNTDCILKRIDGSVLSLKKCTSEKTLYE